MLHSSARPFNAREEPFWQEIEKLVNSDVLHGSESLCRLLRYLAQHALQEPGIRLKEYQIATEVFGRPADFDPQSDSMIRVQAGRLRAKLADYYGSAGAHDSIVVELPKGSYQLQFHRRLTDEQGRHQTARTASALEQHPGTASAAYWRRAAAILALLLVVALVALGFMLIRGSRQPAIAEQTAAPAEFQTFWKPFIRGPEESWLIFSNAAFVGRPETGMRYYNSARDGEAAVWDHYTGVGEVLAVHELDEVFSALHQQLRVKRGSLFSLDDVRNNNLIFLGSPSENLTLGEIPTTHEFVFRRVTEGPRQGDLAIANVHPRPGEPSLFLASPYGAPLTEDYAVIAFMPGLDPMRSVMIFAGTTTFGTQGAVEYASRRNSLKELLARLPVTRTGDLKPFEALLHVNVAHGVPVTADLVAVRP
jgi:hypothetical protein